MKKPSRLSRSLLPIGLLLGSMVAVGCQHSAAAAEPAATSHIDIAVTGDGFVPSRTTVKVGQPVTLVVTRTVEHTCATDIVIKDYGIAMPLPQGEPVDVTFTPTKPGSIHYTCAMGMVAGDLVAE
jgi:plastocyanin domain-containing protein